MILNEIKLLIQQRYALDQEIAQLQLNRLIATQRGRVSEIDRLTTEIRSIGYECREVDRLIAQAAMQLRLPEHFCSIDDDGKVHTILLDIEECTVAVFRTVSTIDSLVDALDQAVR